MSSKKQLVFPLVTTALLPTMVWAAGLERVNIDPSFMYEPGTFAEFSYGSVTPSVPTGAIAVAGGISLDNVAGSFTVSNFAMKTAIGDKIDIGLWNTSNGNGVSIDWAPIGVKAELTMPTMAAMVRYRLTDNVSIIGGLKRVSSDDGANLTLPLTAAGITSATHTLSSTSATTGVYGVVTEIPERGMLMEFLMEGAAALDVDTSYSQTVGGVTTNYTGTAKAGIGDATSVYLQTGIAPGTAVYGKFRMSNWKDDQVQIPLSGTTNRATITTFEDGQSFTLGIKRSFSDTLGGALEGYFSPADSCDSVSALVPKCENRSISLRAQYSLSERATLSVGSTWTQYGDATVGSPATTTTSSSKTSYGFKVGYKF